MSKTLKRILAMVLVICALLSYTVPAAYATTETQSSEEEPVTYNFDRSKEYTAIAPYYTSGGSKKTNCFTNTLLGGLEYLSYTDDNGKYHESKVLTSIPERYGNEELNWTYEAASAGLCGATTDTEHLLGFANHRMMGNGIRSVHGESQWIAFRIESPGAGLHTVELNFYGYENDTGEMPTMAVYILEADGAAVTDLSTTEGHDIVMARQEAIHAAMDPDNRVGKADLSQGTIGAANTAFIGNYDFAADKEYVVVVENYKNAAIAASYTQLTGLTMTPGETDGEELKGDAEVNHILVKNNVVPASDGGYMGAIQEVNGHDYFFLPLEGSKMVIYDMDKYVAGDTDYLVKTVTTGLYYPTHATVTDDGKVIVGGDGKKLFIFDTKTMIGRNTPDFRAADGLQAEGHNTSSYYRAADGLIYFGTAYGGHIARYNMESRTYEDLGDMVCYDVQNMAGISVTADTADDQGSVKAICSYGEYIYGYAISDSYSIIVKYSLTDKAVVGAINVSDQLNSAANNYGMNVLGSKYLIAGGSGASGLVLIDLSTFTLVEYSALTKLCTSTSVADNLWEHGMGGCATEVVGEKQYFYVNTPYEMYSYNLSTDEFALEGTGARALKVNQKSIVTLDVDQDGTDETYVFTYAGGGQPRMFNISTGKMKTLNGLEVDMEAAGGSSINIGDYLDNELFIGAWNNWNCAVFDTEKEEITYRYVTGGQTDSQVAYKDQNGDFHLVSGNYSACVVYAINPYEKTDYDEDGTSNIIEPLIAGMKNYEQKRIHTVEYGDGYVFAGTIPTSYRTGGGVGVYNIESKTWDFVRFKETAANGETVVPNEELWDLSVKGLTYSDGLLYGATSRSGGSGSTPVYGTSAQVFVMDYENMEILATLDLRDYITLVDRYTEVDTDGDGKLDAFLDTNANDREPDVKSDGIVDPINYVGGLTADPLVPGRIWGIVSNVLFCFEYDKDTNTFNVQEILHLGHNIYQFSGGVGGHNRKVVFDTATNSAFISFYNYGTYQIKIADWDAAVGSMTVSASEQILKNAYETYAFAANTNNFYFASGTALYVKPVNVQASDWANAQAVDEMIEALEGDITTDKVDDVAAMKAAYNNLTLREKALVQESRTMLEVEAQLLELQIEEATANVTADSVETLGDLIYQYEHLDESQQRYVQNYTTLETAYSEAMDLNYYVAANAVVEQIAALSDPATLADEEAVTAAREAYDVLDAELQAKVTNLSKLEAAEANIAALKQEAADVQAQIDALNVTSVDDAEAVGAARAAYEALSTEQKALVTNLSALEAAETALAEYTSADEVEALISALPTTVTLDDEAEVNAARTAYNALSDGAKAKVTNLSTLTAAETTIANLKDAKSVQDIIDALPEADAVTLEDEEDIIAARAAYNSTTTAARKLVDTTRLAAAEAKLKALKNAAATEFVYDFKLYQNADYMTWLKDTMVGKGMEETATIGAHTLHRCTVGTIKYDSPMKWFATAYSDAVNWAPEGIDGGNSSYLKNYSITTETGMYLLFEHPTEANTKKDFGALRINVPVSGSYQLDLSLFEGPLSKSYLNPDDVLNVYLIPVDENYTPADYATSNNKDKIATYLTDDTYLAGSLTYQSQANATDTSVYTIGGKHQLDAGEYIIVIQETANNTCRHVYLDSLTLKKVVATVGDQEFGSLNDALDYQVENDAECVKLYSDLEVAELKIPAGAVLDLNGKKLKAGTFDTVAAGAKVIDSTSGEGMLSVEGEVEFSEAYTQLPVYDQAGGYRFFDVTVESVAITGKKSGNPKYWFKISIANFEQLYALIQTGNELDIAVKMSWENDGAADATAGAEFLKKWADKYAAGGDFYITVTAVNTEGLDDFSLIPCMTANGVDICGDNM